MATTEPLIVQIGLTRMAMEFSLRIRPGSPMPTVEVSGELDLESGPCLREQLRPIMRALGAHLAIDLTGVTFIDCSGVNALLASSRDARRLGGWMRVAGAAPCVRRLTEITGLQQVLGVSPASPLNGRAESRSGVVVTDLQAEGRVLELPEQVPEVRGWLSQRSAERIQTPSNGLVVAAFFVLGMPIAG